MSGEHFETILLQMHNTPRFGSIPLYVYAARALANCSEAVAEQAMNGLSGDMPNKRQGIANLILAISALVEDMARDAAGDGYLSDEDWQEQVNKITEITEKLRMV